MDDDRLEPSEQARVRAATLDDAAACQAIYAPYVADTAISFEEQPPDVEEIRVRIAAALSTHAWVVLEEPGPGVVGYAYGGPHKPRAAYRWACEVSVYVEPSRRRTGAGRLLYEALFALLAERGFLVALAGMTLPNPASQGLHRSLGFEDVGTYRRVGWKLGTWHDTHWMQLALTEGSRADEGPPADPS